MLALRRDFCLRVWKRPRNGQKNGVETGNKKNRFVKVPETVAIDAVDAEQTELWESVGH
jgi:hypothetical protein